MADTCVVCSKDISSDYDAQTGSVPGGAREVDPTKGTRRFWNGEWYLFCSLACRSKFEANPDAYI
jgi:hypothetical protein